MPAMSAPIKKFRVRAFAIAVAISSVIAGLVAWFTRLNFWYLFGIVFLAIMINGWIASMEDREK
jgi:hypothetical protein